MNKEIPAPPSLVPLERVACPRSETTDKATRKMIAQMERSILQRFPLTPTGESVEYQTMRFVELQSNGDNTSVRLAVRANDKQYQLPQHKPVEVVTGMCLFGASGLTGRDRSGQKISLTDPYALHELSGEQIQTISELTVMHPSEVESIVRLTGALNALADADKSGDLRVTCHLPAPEYKLYMRQLKNKGMLRDQQFADLVAVIDRRAHAMRQILTKRLTMPVRFESPLAEMDQILADGHTAVSVYSCNNFLTRDPIFGPMITEKRPETLMDVANLSYVAGYFKARARATAVGGGCMAVEIAEEVPIFENAKQISRLTRVPLEMAAVYVPPVTISTTGRYGKQALFMHEPNGDSPLRSLVTVLSNSKNGGL